MKRNKRTGPNYAPVPNFMIKELLKLFGFPSHNAPGEAEAECALLQQEGIVDAVLSEDVDTLMFGCGVTFRNWSSEDSRGKTPTHVSVYDAKATKDGKSGLDREGMVLAALMSGGDYVTEGIPGCGIKVACEAARAGFGKSLCSIPRTDAPAIAAWRENLAYEIRTNENGHFGMKRKALKIPNNFPDPEVLGYYTHPVVSTSAKLAKLTTDIVWEGDIDIAGLRTFVAEAFDWTHKTGAKKFIRGLAPALLVSRLRIRGNRRESGFGDVVYTAMKEMELVRSICGKRAHFSTGGIPELRLVYCPLDIVGLDLNAETEHSDEYDRNGLATNQDYEFENGGEAMESSDDTSPKTRSIHQAKRKPSLYDPNELEKLWVSESIAKVGIPLKVEDWQESQRNPRKTSQLRVVAKKASAKGGMSRGALHRYIKISKPGIVSQDSHVPETLNDIIREQNHLPPVLLAPILGGFVQTHSTDRSPDCKTQSAPPQKKGVFPRIQNTIGTSVVSRVPFEQHKSTGRKGQKEKSLTSKNPWTITSSSPSNPRTFHVSKPGMDLEAKVAFNTISGNHQPPKITRKGRSSPVSSPRATKNTLPASPPLPEFQGRIFKPPSSSPSESPSAELHKRLSRNLVYEELIGGAKFGSQLGENNELTALSSKKFNCKLDLIDKRLDAPQDCPSSPLPSLEELISQKPKTLTEIPQPQEKRLSSQAAQDAIALMPSLPRPVTVSLPPTQRNMIPSVNTLISGNGLAIGKKKKLLVLRESLQGAWMEVEEDESAPARARGSTWRESQVEILDLTGE